MLHPIPAFDDNYIWALHNGQQAWVVDPGDARPVQDWLSSQNLTLEGVLITHHHGDHAGGVPTLLAHNAVRAYGPARETLPAGVHGLNGGDMLDVLGHRFEAIDVPGHTLGHLAYYCADVGGNPLLFSGDTLFSGGCGRLFEGTAAQMLASLDQLAALPGHTRVCCAHEYTLSNLRFATAVEPTNPDLQRYRQWCEAERAAGRPTLPSQMRQELAINPFLRSREPAVRQAIYQHSPATPAGDTAAFAALRQWKDHFR